LSPPIVERPPHRPENEACWDWKIAAMKEPPVRLLPFETKRFIELEKKTRPFKTLVHASPKRTEINVSLMVDIGRFVVYKLTPWNKFVIEEPPFAKLVNTSHTFSRNQRFTTALTGSLYP
jgi:hypothetical protein